MQAKIKNLSAIAILDGGGGLTVEVCLLLSDGREFLASAPNRELNDEQINQQIAWVNQTVNFALAGLNPVKVVSIEETIKQLAVDLPTRSDLAITAVVLAAARAGAAISALPLWHFLAHSFNAPLADWQMPIAVFNLFCGAGDTNLDFSEYLFLANDPLNFSEQITMGQAIYRQMPAVLRAVGLDADGGRLGGYAPDIHSTVQALELILTAGLKAGYQAASDFSLGLNIGSNQIYDQKNQQYLFKLDQNYFSADSLLGLYESWLKKYPLGYLEDGLASADISGWQNLTKTLGKDKLIIGNELFANSLKNFSENLPKHLANTVAISLDRASGLTEIFALAALAKKHHYKILVSGAEAETTDDFAADLAIAVGADLVKFGGLSRGERVGKYNRLLTIENELMKNYDSFGNL